MYEWRTQEKKQKSSKAIQRKQHWAKILLKKHELLFEGYCICKKKNIFYILLPEQDKKKQENVPKEVYMDLRMSVRINSEHNYLNSALMYDMKSYADLEKRLYSQVTPSA